MPHFTSLPEPSPPGREPRPPEPHELAAPVRYLVAVLCVAAAVLARRLLDPWLAGELHYATLVGGVAAAVWLAGWRPALVASVLGFVAARFVFTAPDRSVPPPASFILAVVAGYAISCGIILFVGEKMRRAMRRERDIARQLRAEMAEHAAAEDGRRRAEERLRLALEAGRIGMWTTDLATGETASTPFDKTLFGLPADAPVSSSEEWLARIHPDDREAILAAWKAAGETGAPYAAEFRAVWPDGSVHWLMSRGRFHSGAGKRGRVFGVTIDITARRQTEEALRRAKEEAEAASRAKDDFLAALSHELRTPLTPVLMAAASLETEPALPGGMREQLAMMRRNIELEARLIDDLLDLTRITRGRLEIRRVTANVHRLIEHTAEIVRSDVFGREVQVRFALEAARHHVLGDPARLQQVFWNLIKNAIKFTPPGGSITVSSRDDEASGQVLVSVRDTGIGIAPDQLPRIFKAFEQVAPDPHRFGGLGLGLAISKAIVDLHEGRIEAHSDGAGQGATFTVALQTVAAPKAGDLTRLAPREAARPLRVLIVEDHADTLTVLTRLLGRSGHEVTGANSAAAARAAAAEKEFDVVVSDLGLPDGSGHEVLRAIQQRQPCVGIALSGFGMEEDQRRSREAGFVAHLVKPVNMDELRHLLDQIASPDGAS